MGIHELIGTYFETKDEKYFKEIIDLIKHKNTSYAIKIPLTKPFLLRKVNGITVFEMFLRSNSSFLDWSTLSLIRNDNVFLKMIFDYDRYDLLYYAPEEVFLRKYNGETILEYLFRNNKIHETVVRMFSNSTLIVELCEKYNRLDLLTHLNAKLYTKELSNGKTVFEYLLDHNLISNVMIKQIYDPKLLEIIIKSGKTNLLRYLNESMLIKKINGKMILEDLLSKNVPVGLVFTDPIAIKKIVEMGREKLLIHSSSEVLLTEINNDGTLLFEHLIDKGIIPTSVKSSISYNDKYAIAFVKKLCECGKYSFLTQASEELLLQNIDGEHDLIELLILAGYEPRKDILFKNKKMLEYIIKYQLYNLLSSCSEDLLLTKLNNGKLAIEELLDRGLDINNIVSITKTEIVDIFIKYKRFDLFKHVIVRVLLYNYNLNETYLDLALSELKDDSEIKSLDFKAITNVDLIAQKYIIFARHNLQMYLDSLEVDDLLKTHDNERLIDILLDSEPELTLDRIIEPRVKEDPKIAMIIRIKGLQQKNFKYDSLTRSLDTEYIERSNDRYSDIKLDSECESLLKELRNVMNDRKSNPQLIDLLIKTYRRVLSQDRRFIEEVINLINIKKNNPNFAYKKISAGAYFESIKNEVCMDDENADTLCHETGHALHHLIAGNDVPDGFVELIEKTRKNKEFLRRTKEYSDMYHEIKREVERRVEKTYMTLYDSSHTEEEFKAVKKYLKEEKLKYRDKYIKAGISPSVVDKMLNETYDFIEYYEQDRRIKKNKIVTSIYRIEYGNFMSIGDFVDGITNGYFKNGLLKGLDGNIIRPCSGHGVNYYAVDYKAIFTEMIANYSAIIKSENPEAGLDALRYFIGDEIMDMLIDYYDTRILNSKNNIKSVRVGGR